MTLKILQLNLNGYKSKKQELSTLIQEQKPDIVCLNETKLIKKESISISGYIPIMNNRLDRKTLKSFGGGTAILIRNDIAFDLVRKYQIGKHEIISLSVFPDSRNMKRSFTLFCCYFPPTFTADSDLVKLLFSPNSIIVGDLNAKHSSWGSLKENIRGTSFRDLFDNNNMETYEMPPNYKNKKGEYKEVIQQVITSQDRFFQIEDISSLPNMGSDHLPVSFSVFDPLASSKKTRYLKLYHKLNLNSVSNILSKFSTENVFGVKQVEDKTSLFLSLLKDIDLIVPRKFITSNNQGLSLKTRKLIKERRKVINLLRKNKNSNFLKSKKNHLNREIKNEMKNTQDKRFNVIKSRINQNTTSKKAWKLIKTILDGESKNSKFQTPKVYKKDDGSTVRDKQNIADAHCDRQKSIFEPNESKDNRHKYLVDYWFNNTQFHLREYNSYHHFNPILTKYVVNEPILLSEVTGALKGIKPNKAPGDDGVKNKLLISISEQVAPALTSLFNDWLNNSIFPSQLKTAKIQMIPKKPNTTKISEHRPISLLPTIGKLFEKIIADRIYKWAEDKNILNNEQSGFRKNRSTVDNLFQLINDFQEAKISGERMHAVFVDFEKAFDKVNHSLLLYKLNFLGIPKYLLHILHSYLSNRKAFIQHHDFKSSTFVLKAGVPQGSCLSPILFSIFVSDVPKPPNSKVKLSQFADDLGTWERYKKARDSCLDEYMEILFDWFDKWGLVVNLEKTKHVNFGQSKLTIWVRNTRLKKATEYKFLGITIDKKLNLITHTTDKINKSYHILNFLSTLKNQYSMDKKKLLMFYKSLLRSRFEYSHICLLSMSNFQLHRLELIQNQALRIILNKPRWTRITDMYAEAKITSIKDRLISLSKSWFNKALNTPPHPINHTQYINRNNPDKPTLYELLQSF